MADAKTPIDFSKIFDGLLTTQENAIKLEMGKSLYIIIDDDEERLKSMKEADSDTSTEDSIDFHFFSDGYDCMEFLCERISDDPAFEAVVLVGGQRVCEHVREIKHCEQVKRIIVFNPSMPSAGERETLEAEKKVIILADVDAMESLPLMAEQECDSSQFDLIYQEGVEHMDESVERFNHDFVFRYVMLTCLLNAPPGPSDKDDLIDLFMTIDPQSKSDIETFRATYSSDQAILFYTREPIIYGHLNRALRTKNINQLVPFRSILQDIHRQLHEQMNREPVDQEFTCFRSQQCSPLEIACLLSAFNHHTPFVTKTFFSTSKDPKVPLGFIDHTKQRDLFGTQVYFTIIARKQDASRHFPFADITKMSHHPDEVEVLFAPGQIFQIDNIEIEFKDHVRVYSVTMTTMATFGERSDLYARTAGPLLDKSMGDWLLVLGGWLVCCRRYDEAKALYTRCLSNYDDQDKRYLCYQGLLLIASNEGDVTENERLFLEMIKTKCTLNQPFSMLDPVPLDETESQDFSTSVDKLKEMCSRLSFDQLLDDSDASGNFDQLGANLEELAPIQQQIAKILMAKNLHQMAIVFLEASSPANPIARTKHNVLLGDCYRKLNSNDAALAKYQWVLEQGVPLAADGTIEVLNNLASILEVMNRHEDALHAYIRIAELYKENPHIGGTDERHQTEQAIRRVLPRIIPLD